MILHHGPQQNEMTIQDLLAEWDGKSVNDLELIYHKFSVEKDFVDQLIEMLRTVELNNGALWLLKHYFESSKRLSAQKIDAVYASLPMSHGWQSKLLFLQCIPYMPIEESHKIPIEQFLKGGIIDSNAFVRAWSYNGFHQLAQQYPEYQKQVQEFFEMALRDETASVKARIRNIIKNTARKLSENMNHHENEA